ncbi:MAG: glycoside hydrolase family 5 protein [Deinococcales bacterium]
MNQSSLSHPLEELELQAMPALGRTVNFGNALEAPNEGDWGITLEAEYFRLAKEAGFQSIRLPISWTHHTASSSPYTIDPSFFSRIDWAIDQAKRNGLKIIINDHHHDELNNNPQAERARYLAIWQQIAERYQGYGAFLYFELLNEPHGAFNTNPALWNEIMTQALNVVRQTNPTRKVIVGPVYWNSIGSLADLVLPESDRNLFVTVHFYSPFEFTHQGAEWVSPVPPVGVKWWGDVTALAALWDNYSWDTSINWRRSKSPSVQITFNQGWAGFYVHRESPWTGVDTLQFSVDTALELFINCGNDHGIPFSTQAGWHTYTLALSECGTGSNQDIFIQNATPSPKGPFLLRNFKLLGPNNKVISILSNEKGQIRQSFSLVKSWSRTNRRPIFVGEFGAYNKADMDSRIRWTRSVRETAESYSFAWAYWEFAAGFGIYDPQAGNFRQGLLEALIPPQ